MKHENDIIWRKTKWLVVSVILTHIINVVRVTLQLYLASQGFAWEMVHDSISDFTAYIAAILFIIYLGYKWIPEFFLSIYYGMVLISNKIFKGKVKAEAYPIKRRTFIVKICGFTKYAETMGKSLRDIYLTLIFSRKYCTGPLPKI